MKILVARRKTCFWTNLVLLKVLPSLPELTYILLNKFYEVCIQLYCVCIYKIVNHSCPDLSNIKQDPTSLLPYYNVCYLFQKLQWRLNCAPFLASKSTLAMVELWWRLTGKLTNSCPPRPRGLMTWRGIPERLPGPFSTGMHIIYCLLGNLTL